MILAIACIFIGITIGLVLSEVFRTPIDCPDQDCGHSEIIDLYAAELRRRHEETVQH